MTFSQIYNMIWMIVWMLLGIVSAWGMFHNWVHIITLAACVYFSMLLFNDTEDGESLKQLLQRKLNKANR